MPPFTGNETQHILTALNSSKISGDGFFSKECQAWFENYLNCPKTLLTPSCTHALEMAAMLIDIQPGDEVIMPSYTFVSTANAFVVRGAKIVFIDIRPDTLNMDEALIEAAITSKTKAIVPVHYAGVSCAMQKIMSIANQHNLFVIEDAAQAMMSTYQSQAVGTRGHLATFSFHETKNYTSGGEGGLLIINDANFCERAEIIREKGTNRSNFFRGLVDKYTWVDVGSSYLPCELQAAYLWGQLEKVDEIFQNRSNSWQTYYQQFQALAATGAITLPHTPQDCVHNAHIFYLKVKDLTERTALLEHLKKDQITAVFHYVPLHDSVAGKKYGQFIGDDKYTTSESERLVRLPLFYGLKEQQIEHVVQSIGSFYH